MMTEPDSFVSFESTDVVSLLRLLAEAPDSQAFFATLRGALPALLPATRVDLLASDRPDYDYLPLVGDDDRDLPGPAARSAAGFAEWLGGRGYASVSTLPLTGAGQHLGWLALARRREPLGPTALTLAGQLAAIIALRLLYDLCRADLVERDKHAAQLERQLRDYEELRLRATLALGAAHDIGNLFASVMGHAQMLQQDAPAALQRDLRSIVLAANDGSQLMRRIMTLNVPAATRLPTPIVLLPTLIQDVLDLTRPFWGTRAGITVRTMLASVPPVRVHAAELREVLVNLIMNAVSAMPAGGVLTLRSFAADDLVMIEVIDTGQGIAREYQGAIFQPFATTREGGGGLGLSISRTIVESYGGTLTVRSTADQGATFVLALPAIRPHDAPREAQSSARSRVVS
jgi:signal transduction histidine kinase